LGDFYSFSREKYLWNRRVKTPEKRDKPQARKNWSGRKSAVRKIHYAVLPVMWTFMKLHFAMTTKLVIWNMVIDMWTSLTSEETTNFGFGAQDHPTAQMRTTSLVLIVWCHITIPLDFRYNCATFSLKLII
jgi:hypothetical protein